MSCAQDMKKGKLRDYPLDIFWNYGARLFAFHSTRKPPAPAAAAAARMRVRARERGGHVTRAREKTAVTLPAHVRGREGGWSRDRGARGAGMIPKTWENPKHEHPELKAFGARAPPPSPVLTGRAASLVPVLTGRAASLVPVQIGRASLPMATLPWPRDPPVAT